MNNAALTVLRVVVGIIFAAHGFAKFQMGLDNVSGWFSSIGIPGFLGYVVAVLELVGGIALIVGLGTRVISAALGFIMIGAIITVKGGNGLMGADGAAGYEFDLALLAMLVALAMAKGSALSVDGLLFGKKSSTEVKG
ncbi:DoxX family protein [Brevibacillus dissolubilis]|uniref:DoxX family protein n=1 Tax=Brevibacillus dissolubilis TaxID=1844116 RepID=UPI001116FDE6|nr:DoxX family protein [Brevibacillus dissolubilis]